MNIPFITIYRPEQGNLYGFYVGYILEQGKQGRAVAIGYSHYEVICNYLRAIQKGQFAI